MYYNYLNLYTLQIMQPVEEIPDEFAYLGYALIIGMTLYILFYAFKNYYAAYLDRPIYRHLLVYKKLSETQAAVLRAEISFYNKLSEKEQKQFEHRVKTFIHKVDFIGREGLEVTDRMQVIISAIACMITFGRKKYVFDLIDRILVYPDEFYSTVNDAFHKGEFNPRQRMLVFSWNDFEKGYKIEDDNFNLGIHEFTHAMHIEGKVKKDMDGSRFLKHFQQILHRLADKEVKDTLDETHYFRAYAFTNQYEFMAVLAEYFFESPEHLKMNFPTLYTHVRKMLNMQYAGY